MQMIFMPVCLGEIHPLCGERVHSTSERVVSVDATSHRDERDDVDLGRGQTHRRVRHIDHFYTHRFLDGHTCGGGKNGENNQYIFHV